MNRGASLFTILIAEDDPDDQLFAQEAFAEITFTGDVRIVEDGEALMAYLRQEGKYSLTGDAPCPRFILLDLNMPKKDGHEALIEIKSDPILCCIPVIILTTSRAEQDVKRAYTHGANSFVIKPAAFLEFVEMLRSLVLYWSDIVTLPPVPYTLIPKRT